MNIQWLNLSKFKVNSHRPKYKCVRYLRHLVCTAVVSGLVNFTVGMPSGLPAVGSLVNTNSYTVCGTWSGYVQAGIVVTVDCAYSTQKFRYVIVQSLFRSPVRLCLVEVNVNSTSQYAILHSYCCSNITITAYNACLSESGCDLRVI